MKASFLTEGLAAVALVTLEIGAAAHWAPNLLSHLWAFPLFLIVAIVIAFVPWLELWDDFRERDALKKIESRFPGMRATKLSGSGNVLLTERATGATFRELMRGRDF